MNTEIYETRLAFLLALSELKIPLNEGEKKTLADIATQLDLQPLAWKDFTEPMLLKMIESNRQLNQHYVEYKTKLGNCPEIPQILSETEQELYPLMDMSATVRERGFKSKANPTGYEGQINNVVFVVSRSEKPEAAVKKLSSLDKLKQMLDESIL
ncbi:MAG: hypothetical protein QNJ64_19725 [Crocosphaera sp.]|nr:hypothetical protein [Crocosphaera sp.]